MNRPHLLFALALALGLGAPSIASAQDAPTASEAPLTSERRPRAYFEINAGVEAFLLYAGGETPLYVGGTVVPGIRLSLGIDEETVHRIFVSLRYSGLAAVSPAAAQSPLPTAPAVSVIDHITVMAALGYSVGFSDIPIRLGVEIGVANVPFEDRFVNGGFLGVFLDAGIPFALG